MFSLLSFITSALQSCLRQTNGRGVLVDSRCRCNRGCFSNSEQGILGGVLQFYLLSERIGEEHHSADWDHPMPTLNNSLGFWKENGQIPVPMTGHLERWATSNDEIWVEPTAYHPPHCSVGNILEENLPNLCWGFVVCSPWASHMHLGTLWQEPGSTERKAPTEWLLSHYFPSHNLKPTLKIYFFSWSRHYLGSNEGYGALIALWDIPQHE